MKDLEIYFIKKLNRCIKISRGVETYYLYDKALILEYKIAQLKGVNTIYNRFKDIKWKNNLVIFKQVDTKYQNTLLIKKDFWLVMKNNFNMDYDTLKIELSKILNKHLKIQYNKYKVKLEIIWDILYQK